MSTRGLAICGFAIFMVAFVYEMEEIRGRIPSMFPSLSAPACPQPASLGRVEAYLFIVFSELAQQSWLQAEALKKAHPDLAPEIRYRQFEASVSQQRSVSNFLKFQPLREYYKDDYEALKARYTAEHPDIKLPGE